MKNVQGIKNIQIHATTRYPIVSAYEFEFLKDENQVQKLLEPCTIYFIIQRPLIYINNFSSENGVIYFEIVDDTGADPLFCRFIPSENGFCNSDEELIINALFYKKDADTKQPFNMMAGFKLFTLNDRFLGWFSPQVFLYQFLSGKISAQVVGEIEPYLEYTVHYIGKSFSQDIWNRLTGHHKMQKILTLEDSLNTQELKAPFEISLLMLDIDGYDESNVFPIFDFAVPNGIEAIVHEFNFEDGDESFENYYYPKLLPKSPVLTTETEAFLVNKFKPGYNDILFDNYPNIKNGTRDAGYTCSVLVVDNLPVILKTKTHTQYVMLPEIS
ncbi:conserved hypothetical protein [Pectobacterium parmentieri WPP163]|uniref:hypothetical protein n=1 Tax=Pectobacterium parmentieri TaxID=1905730 RepID=UPI0001B0E91A|nr:hypothetical protein [Pectobacterium parmentieri]ACX87401.1 conserved hypothetical protein [Pectobacterium parmentieri WPP163]